MKLQYVIGSQLCDSVEATASVEVGSCTGGEFTPYVLFGYYLVIKDIILNLYSA